MEKNNKHIEEWDVVTTLLPLGWELKAKELQAFQRRRAFDSPSEQLRAILMHVATGHSMRVVATKLKYERNIDISDVALLKKMRTSADWLRWIALGLIHNRGISLDFPEWLSDFNVRCIDASVVTEPGSTGTDWRLHYSHNLFNLKCDEFIITSPKVGESISNFKINSSDLFLIDRAYCSYKGISEILGKKANFVVRYKHKGFTLYNSKNDKVDIIKELKSLKLGQIFDKIFFISSSSSKNKKIPVRICAIKKSKEQAELSRKKAKKNFARKQQTISSTALGLNDYIVLVTSLINDISSNNILELYRMRWQVEISFKKLKSQFGLGHLPKKDKNSARAWLYAKMITALLTQAIIDEGERFSPWGYRFNKRE